MSLLAFQSLSADEKIEQIDSIKLAVLGNDREKAKLHDSFGVLGEILLTESNKTLLQNTAIIVQSFSYLRTNVEFLLRFDIFEVLVKSTIRYPAVLAEINFRTLIDLLSTNSLSEKYHDEQEYAQFVGVLAGILRDPAAAQAVSRVRRAAAHAAGTRVRGAVERPESAAVCSRTPFGRGRPRRPEPAAAALLRAHGVPRLVRPQRQAQQRQRAGAVHQKACAQPEGENGEPRAADRRARPSHQPHQGLARPGVHAELELQDPAHNVAAVPAVADRRGGPGQQRLAGGGELCRHDRVDRHGKLQLRPHVSGRRHPVQDLGLAADSELHRRAARGLPRAGDPVRRGARDCGLDHAAREDLPRAGRPHALARGRGRAQAVEPHHAVELLPAAVAVAVGQSAAHVPGGAEAGAQAGGPATHPRRHHRGLSGRAAAGRDPAQVGGAGHRVELDRGVFCRQARARVRRARAAAAPVHLRVALRLPAHELALGDQELAVWRQPRVEGELPDDGQSGQDLRAVRRRERADPGALVRHSAEPGRGPFQLR
ncbi:hypothetical protein KL942_004965 [Ogataea angusta]|uniref:Uncharacterized protein n=1 Tax=Pichia angusta TaxID=870730 RepID=A0ABQ7RQY6_PICAN|nr:hypothetical protein KL942_004965 [Ogataea angusta]KAG7845990.1 hypothetical protein KL940_004829 [Ogataea angusta]